MTETLQQHITDLAHPDKNVRSAAAVALGRVGGREACAALLAVVGQDADFYVREDITWALVRIGAEAVEPLIAMLADADENVRHHAAHTLSKIGDPRAVKPLAGVLHDRSAAVVSKAIFTLGTLVGEEIVPMLVPLLGHPDTDVQNTLITALERIGRPALPHLIPALKDENPQVRELAADAIGMIRQPENVPYLTPLLGDDDWRVRFATLTALGHIGGAQAKAAILAMPPDADKRVAQLGAKMIRRMGA